MPRLPLLQRLRAIRRLPPQILLILGVSAAAAASGLYGTLQRDASSPAPPAALSPEPPDPDEELSLAVESAYEAALRGDLNLYLAQFAEPLASQLLGTRREKGDAYLRDYLRRQTAPLRGLAADLTRRQDIEPGSVRLPVEFVYADRNELQWFVLRRTGDGWRISSIEGVRSAPTLIPYGTPVQNVR